MLAVGPGNDADSTAMPVKEGDRVIYSQYAGTEVKFEEEEYIIVGRNDIIAVVE